MTKGLAGGSPFFRAECANAGVVRASARTGMEARAASAPPMKVLLCVLVGSCPFRDVLWLAKPWWLSLESVLSFGISNFTVFIVFSLFSFLSFDRMAASSARLLQTPIQRVLTSVCSRSDLLSLGRRCPGLLLEVL